MTTNSILSWTDIGVGIVIFCLLGLLAGRLYRIGPPRAISRLSEPRFGRITAGGLWQSGLGTRPAREVDLAQSTCCQPLWRCRYGHLHHTDESCHRDGPFDWRRL
jgi:hypothetical protein